MEYQEVVNTTHTVPTMVSPEHVEAVEIVQPQVEVITPEVIFPTVERIPLETKIMNSVHAGESYDRILNRVANNEFPEYEVSAEEVTDQEQLAPEGVLFDQTDEKDMDMSGDKSEQFHVDIHPAVKENSDFQQKLDEVIQEQQENGEVDQEAAEQEAYRRYMEEQENADGSEVEQEVLNDDVEREIQATENLIDAVEALVDSVDQLSESVDGLSDSIDGLSLSIDQYSEALTQLTEQLKTLLIIYQSEKSKKGENDPDVQVLREIITRLKVTIARLVGTDPELEMVA